MMNANRHEIFIFLIVALKKYVPTLNQLTTVIASKVTEEKMQFVEVSFCGKLCKKKLNRSTF